MHLLLALQMHLWGPMGWAEGLYWELRMLSWWKAAQQMWLPQRQVHPCPYPQTGMQRDLPGSPSELSPEQRS